MNYLIRRPPAKLTFELPTREEILALEPGASVKLIFLDGNGQNGERMWVRLKNVDTVDLWTGTLNGQPMGDALKKTLSLDDEVSFHPFDIIDIYN